ncbi:Uncharacterized protein APZ42_021593 [Daphnia magna]|uniref:Uncharacterized protein n=1 Tax=Daphnia magna TaxID=35525 RepID=A0A164WJI6_9CRUS|nr:Uncharacterized protein APZ42_021593 [Daphnia magna]
MYIDDAFPIKKSLIKRIKAQYPQDPAGFALKLVGELYSREFLEPHKKTNTNAKIGFDLKIPIRVKELSYIRNTITEVYGALDSKTKSGAEMKISQKFNIKSKDSVAWLKKFNELHKIDREVDKTN